MQTRAGARRNSVDADPEPPVAAPSVTNLRARRQEVTESPSYKAMTSDKVVSKRIEQFEPPASPLKRILVAKSGLRAPKAPASPRRNAQSDDDDPDVRRSPRIARRMSADVAPEDNPFAAASSSAASPSRRAAKPASPARPSAPTPRSAANGGPIAVPVVEVEVRRPRAALADRLAAPSSPHASPVSPKPSQLPAPGAMAATDFPTFNRATYSPTVSPMRTAAGPSSVSQLVPPSPSKIIATARDVFTSKLRNEVQASPQRPSGDDDEPVFEDDDDEDNVSEPDLDRRVNLSQFLLKEDLADEDEQDDDDFRYVGDEDEDEDEEADEEDDVDLTEELDSENEMMPAVLAAAADRARSPVPAQPAHFIGWVEQRASTALAARQAKRRPATAAANVVSPAMVALHRFLSVLLPLFVVFFGAYCFFFQRSPWTLDCATLTADAAVVRRSLLVALVELVATVREQLSQL